METINYKLEKFEGPLDLCLTLIRKNKMSIDDIQISVLCDQYMDYIKAAGQADIELSSDFLLMESELMLIKSKMLLPRNEEEEEDPRAALAAAMIEYERAKESSVLLRDMFSRYGTRMIKDTDEIAPDKTYVSPHSVQLKSSKKVRLDSFFRSAESRSELVSMFLAMLELLKSGMLILEEENLDETDEGVIDAVSGVTVSLEKDADISGMINLISEE